MIKFPGQEENFLLKDGIKNYGEPLLEVGKLVDCVAIKVTPTIAHFLITRIDGLEPAVNYKAFIKYQDLKMNIAENRFVCDKIKQGSFFKAKVISYGDSNGVCLSLS